MTMADEKPIEPDEVNLAPVKKGPGKQLFKKGQSGNPGGRPKAVQDAWAAMRAGLPTAVDELLKLIEGDNLEAKKWALDRFFRLMGPPPPMPVTPVQAVPKSDETTLTALEQLLTRYALDGDRDALYARLAALAPEKYAPKRAAAGDGDGEGKPTVLSFERLAPGEVPPRPGDS